MKASVGDRIVFASSQVDAAVRDGRVVEVRGKEGAPPYSVEWSDTGRVALVFPGPDAHVEHLGDGTQAPPPATHVKTWHVRIDLFESGADTSANATLAADAPAQLQARGRTHRHTDDTDVPEIGDEIAAARALRRLADRLLAAAADDLSAVEGRPVSVRG